MLPKLTSKPKKEKVTKDVIPNEQVETEVKETVKPKKLTKKEEISALADSWTKLPKSTYTINEEGERVPVQSIPDIDDLDIKGEIKKYLG